jgi:hypothetical protein
MAANVKFNNVALEELKKSFNDTELNTINMLMEGKTKYNSIKNVHLDTFRKIICLLSENLNWSEKEEILEEQKNEEVENNSVDVKNDQQKKEICKFLKRGKCQYGRSGKKTDSRGNICSFNHPQVCKNHELYGQCRNHRCKKLQLSLCRNYMSTMKCNYDDCKFYHPRRISQNQNSTTGQEYKEDTPTYAQVVRKKFVPKMNYNDPRPFLGPKQSVISQEKSIQPNIQESFLEFMNSQKEMLRRLEKLEIQTKQSQNHYMKW